MRHFNKDGSTNFVGGGEILAVENGNRIRRETDQDAVKFLKLENALTKLSSAIFVEESGEVVVWCEGLF